MISIGLKETESVTFDNVMKDFILEHYSEDGEYYNDEISDFNDLRDATMTPCRDEDGIDLLYEYYNQLYFIDNRFFPPSRPLGVFLSWYDSLTGLVSIQKTCAFEKASVLFNIGALFTQIGSRTTRLKRDGIEDAIESFQHAAGAFNYIRLNFSNAPTADMSPARVSRPDFYKFLGIFFPVHFCFRSIAQIEALGEVIQINSKNRI